jgi:hypothetical protein
MLTAKRFFPLLMILCMTFCKSAFPQDDTTYSITSKQLTNIVLTFDSLDECKETVDSLKSQIRISDALIHSDSLIRLNLTSQIANGESQITLERHISSEYRKKVFLWKLLFCIAAGVNVYQIVK